MILAIYYYIYYFLFAISLIRLVRSRVTGGTLSLETCFVFFVILSGLDIGLDGFKWF